MKFCKDCKHTHEVPEIDILGLKLPHNLPMECHAPKAEQSRDPVTGDWPTCQGMRKNFNSGLSELCGREAKWFKRLERPNETPTAI